MAELGLFYKLGFDIVLKVQEPKIITNQHSTPSTVARFIESAPFTDMFVWYARAKDNAKGSHPTIAEAKTVRAGNNRLIGQAGAAKRTASVIMPPSRSASGLIALPP